MNFGGDGWYEHRRKRDVVKKIKNTVRKPYHEKYDCANLGTNYVFSWFYEFMAGMGVVSNIVMCCGEDYKRYIGYANMIATGRAKAFFVEKEKDRFDRVREGVSGHKNIVPMKYNVFHYMDSPEYSLVKPVRVLDLGLGIGIKRMLLNAAPLLQDQSAMNRKLWKAQILDSSIRFRSSKFIVDCYEGYLKPLDLKIKSINGINIVNDPDRFCMKHEHATLVKNYHDRLLKRRTKVYEHRIILEKNNKQAILIMFECMNGSPMLQSLLLFK